MPALANPRREAFAQALASGATRRNAMLTAGYRYDRGNAYALAGQPDITERVAELLSAKAQESTQSLAALMAEMAAIQLEETANKRLARALAALIVRAKLAGFWPSEHRKAAELGKSGETRHTIRRAMRRR